jgi:molybdopterin synthase sulfur carrier subunit
LSFFVVPVFTRPAVLSRGRQEDVPRTAPVRVELPVHLRTLARVGVEIALVVPLEAEGRVTPRAILDALEAAYPMLRGTIRDQVTHQRRPFLRFFACGEDLSHDSMDAPLPQEITSGKEPFLIVGAIAGG